MSINIASSTTPSVLTSISGRHQYRVIISPEMETPAVISSSASAPAKNAAPRKYTVSSCALRVFRVFYEMLTVHCHRLTPNSALSVQRARLILQHFYLITKSLQPDRITNKKALTNYMDVMLSAARERDLSAQARYMKRLMFTLRDLCDTEQFHFKTAGTRATFLWSRCNIGLNAFLLIGSKGALCGCSKHDQEPSSLHLHRAIKWR